MPKRAFADLSLGWNELCRNIEQMAESKEQAIHQVAEEQLPGSAAGRRPRARR